MGLETQHIDADAVVLETRIPEISVAGLEYGGHVNMGAHGWSAYYVRPVGTERWGVARLTPASDELPEVGVDEWGDEIEGDTLDAAIVRAIAAELA